MRLLQILFFGVRLADVSRFVFVVAQRHLRGSFFVSVFLVVWVGSVQSAVS